MSPPAKLLIVDDNPVVLFGFSESMRSAGLEVLEARNGEEGLRLARENSPDLVLLDVMLPDVNGIELCRRIRADPALKSLFLVLLSSSQT